MSKKEWKGPTIVDEYSYDARFQPILDRINQYIPFNLIVEFFTSDPLSTGGQRRFPYFRVDEAISLINDNISLSETYKTQERIEKEKEKYKKAALYVMRLLLWIDVGIQGWVNYADCSFANSSHRIKLDEVNKTNQWHRETIVKFIRYRNDNSISDDCFVQYGVERLLEGYQS